MSDAVEFSVYTAQFPFMESDNSKTRPVIVISEPHGRHKIVVVAPISSKTKREPVDCTLQNWQQAALALPNSSAFLNHPNLILAP